MYRSGDLFSYSAINLIKANGRLELNKQYEAWHSVDHPCFVGEATVCRNVSRVPPEVRLSAKQKDPQAYAEALCEAVVDDVHAVERRFSGWKNIVLVGGKDSLNLLLLPWRNPVVAYSADPNYPLVREFVERNSLPLQVVHLQDDAGDLHSQVVENATLLSLQHCRWTGHLDAIAKAHAGEVVFWKGQLGDVFNTPYWQRYASFPVHRSAPRGIQRFKSWGARLIERIGREDRSPLEVALETRGAYWQGTHMALLRGLLNAPVLSAYHGARAERIWSTVDRQKAVQMDLRPLMGELWAGKPVWYPDLNPSPAPIIERRAANSIDVFLEAIVSVSSDVGLRIELV